MRIQRLLDMGPAELAFRARQEAFKAAERLTAPGDAVQRKIRFDHSVAGTLPADPDRRSTTGGTGGFTPALHTRLLERAGERFFAGLCNDSAGETVGRRCTAVFADDVRKLVERADAICRGRFETLGYGELSFGDPVDWHLDPVSGHACPRRHWSRIDPLDPGQVGDSKVVWELNRHQWMLDLGQAYRLTGDEAYADRFIALVTHWLEQNPYARGINWSSALEVAMRLISWCWAISLFRCSPALRPDTLRPLLASLQRHAGFIERNLSRYFSPNTHLTVEALGLYYAGTVLPELRGAHRWRQRGREVLLEQLPIQVSDEGVYFEQSTRYQYYTAEIYLHFSLLAHRNNDRLPGTVDRQLRRMMHVLLAARRPDGTVPQVGDTDGGWLCPLVRREPGDYQGLFATAAIVLDDPQLAWAAGGLAMESLWLLGPEAESRWSRLSARADPPRQLARHVAGAFVSMRSGWDGQAHQLLFDTGPLGCHVSAGHGHADLLAVQCSAFGDNYLVDPGTGCYTADSPWRSHFRGTAAHSTVLVDGRNQAETDGPFSWRQRPVTRFLGWESGSGSVFAAAQHDAYTLPGDPVTHRRRVWFPDSGYWLIVDDLLGSRPHALDLRFQFAPLPVRQETDGWVRARGPASGLLLKTFCARAPEIHLVTGGQDPVAGWYSPNYGQQLPAPALTLRVQGNLPVRLATLLIPLRDPDAPPPAVSAEVEEGVLTALAFNDLSRRVPDFDDADLGRSGVGGRAR